jgi:cytochrome c553
MPSCVVRPLILPAVAVLAVAVCQNVGTESAIAEESKPTDKVSFSKDIQPLLAEKCGNCHGTKKPKKGIDYVTSYDTVMRTVKAGKPDESRLFRSVSGKGGKPMPPKSPLEEDEIAKIKAWISDGAKKN